MTGNDYKQYMAKILVLEQQLHATLTPVFSEYNKAAKEPVAVQAALETAAALCEQIAEISGLAYGEIVEQLEAEEADRIANEEGGRGIGQ